MKFLFFLYYQGLDVSEAFSFFFSPLSLIFTKPIDFSF